MGIAQPLTVIIFFNLFCSFATFRLKPIKTVTMTESDFEAYLRGVLKATFQLKPLSTINMTDPGATAFTRGVSTTNMTDPSVTAFLKGFLAGALSTKIKMCVTTPIDTDTIGRGLTTLTHNLIGGITTLIAPIKSIVDGFGTCGTAADETWQSVQGYFDLPPFEKFFSNIMKNFSRIMKKIQSAQAEMESNNFEWAGEDIGTVIHYAIFGSAVLG